MGEYKFKSAGVTVQSLGTSSPTPPGVRGPAAGVIGTAERGPAFVPVVFGDLTTFTRKFGDVDGSRFGPIAVSEWMRSAGHGLYLRVLGSGDCTARAASGEVSRAGFTVGEQLPSGSTGAISENPFANLGGPLGRTYFLGCFMSESVGSTVFSSAGLQGVGSDNGIVAAAVPIVRAVLMAPSGVILRLSSSAAGVDSSAPPASFVADEATSYGSSLGAVTLKDDINDSQKFVLLINGLSGSAASTAVTASFDLQSPIYFSSVFNTTASLIQEKGHYLAAHWDIHASVAALTGVGVVTAGADVPSDSTRLFGQERSAFLLTSSLSRDTGSSTVPNYESFRDRFSHAASPWFTSQKIHGEVHDLFRFHALDAGSGVANKYKITIGNITPSDAVMDDPGKIFEIDSGYGSFDVIIRSIDDSDISSTPLEVYKSLSLDPSSDNFISKKIGDIHTYYDFDRPEREQKIVVEGDYPLVSRYVRVEVAADVKERSAPSLALPFGFRGMYHVVTSGSAPLAPLSSADTAALLDQYYTRNAVVPPLPMRVSNVSADGSAAPYPERSWGLVFDHTAEDTNDVLLYTNESFDAITSFFPVHHTTDVNFSVGDNSGAPDTAANGILDADRFCRNYFTLENIKIVTGSTGLVSPPSQWNLARYVRSGKIEDDPTEKSRRVSLFDLRDPQSRNYLTFTTVLQGGFDGVNMFDTDERDLTNAAAVADMLDPARGRLEGPTVSSYTKALSIISDTTLTEMSVLALPGIREEAITNRAADVAEARGDTFYVMDITEMGTVQDTVDEFKSRIMDSTYVGVYYPDVVVKLAQDTEDEYTVPPSVVVLGALALNDAVGAEWTAPAGHRRGRLTTTLKTVIPLEERDLDLLYSNNINPIYAPTDILTVTPSPSGVVVWGQKTQCRGVSSLERIDVRRMLIALRRRVRSLALSYMFAPSTAGASERLRTEIESIVRSLRSSGAFEQYRVEVDPLSNTRAGLENSLIKGRVFIKPNKSTIFLPLDFVVSADLESEL